MRTGVIVFAHGSRLEPANEAVRAVAADLARRTPAAQILAAFLELGTPGLVDAALAMAEEGVERVIVAPYFLTPGLHLDRDLPKLIEEIRQAKPGLDVCVTQSLDGHPSLAAILWDRIQPELKG
jgi:sirohydrochlorin cobaltochelatase